jgi:hypothetical protein
MIRLLRSHGGVSSDKRVSNLPRLVRRWTAPQARRTGSGADCNGTVGVLGTIDRTSGDYNGGSAAPALLAVR